MGSAHEGNQEDQGPFLASISLNNYVEGSLALAELPSTYSKILELKDGEE